MTQMTPAAVNYWPESACAKAFWRQHELPPYQRLLADTAAWLEPRPGERWLDLGCGGGQLTRALWQKSGGTLREIIGVDCAAVNEKAFARLRTDLVPAPTAEQVRFLVADFSNGLCVGPEAGINGVVSGLSIQYAESYSEPDACWTTAAYDRVLAEVFRLLRPGGTFVFSVNVPEPAWGRVALAAVAGTFRARRPLHYLKDALRMWSYGGWLTREARRGRFHYLPRATILTKLTATGFTAVEHRLSYVGQAFLFRCRKPA